MGKAIKISCAKWVLTDPMPPASAIASDNYLPRTRILGNDQSTNVAAVLGAIDNKCLNLKGFKGHKNDIAATKDTAHRLPADKMCGSWQVPAGGTDGNGEKYKKAENDACKNFCCQLD